VAQARASVQQMREAMKNQQLELEQQTQKLVTQQLTMSKALEDMKEQLKMAQEKTVAQHELLKQALMDHEHAESMKRYDAYLTCVSTP
jgi:Sec-independent protein translocase protein TatA